MKKKLLITGFDALYCIVHDCNFWNDKQQQQYCDEGCFLYSVHIWKRYVCTCGHGKCADMGDCGLCSDFSRKLRGSGTAGGKDFPIRNIALWQSNQV